MVSYSLPPYLSSRDVVGILLLSAKVVSRLSKCTAIMPLLAYVLLLYGNTIQMYACFIYQDER